MIDPSKQYTLSDLQEIFAGKELYTGVKDPDGCIRAVPTKYGEQLEAVIKRQNDKGPDGKEIAKYYRYQNYFTLMR